MEPSRRFVLALVLALLLPLPSRAEGDGSGLGIGDELALLKEEDVVVSASRHAQPIDESPSAITVITHDEIVASGYHDLTDVMRLVPGADVLRVSQVQTAVGLRTGSSWGGDLLLVLVDGRDVSLHLLAQPMWAAMPFDLDSIERIEVIRGPAGSLYGANALQGVVNIVTRRPAKGRVETSVSLSGANAGTVSADAHADGTLGRFGYWLSAGYEIASPPAHPFEQDMSLARGRALVTYTPSNDLAASLELGWVSTKGRLSTFVGGGTGQNSWPYLMAHLDWKETHVVLILDENDAVIDVDSLLILPQTGQRIATTPPFVTPTRSAELSAQTGFSPFAGNHVIVGVQARAIDHLPGSIVTCPQTTLTAFDPKACTPATVLETRLGAFVQDEWWLSKSLLLNAGARVDVDDLNPDLGWAPRVALMWKLTKNQVLRASVGRAYRKPNYLETRGSTLLDIAPNGPQDLGRRLDYIFASGVGNRSLKNESNDSYELGWRGRFFGGKLDATVDLFHLVAHDTIVGVNQDLTLEPGFGGVPTIPDDARITFANENPGILGTGGEATLTARPAHGVTVDLSYALDLHYDWMTSGGTKGYVLDADFEPAHRVIGSVRLDLPAGMHLSADAIWTSRYHASILNPASALAPPLRGELGGTTLVNVSLRYRHAVGKEHWLEVGATVTNLLDLPIRDVPGGYYDGNQYGGELLARRIRLFVRGRF